MPVCPFRNKCCGSSTAIFPIIPISENQTTIPKRCMGPVEFLSDIRFHQDITVPPNPKTGLMKPLRVSYSDYGDPLSNAVVLFCGALMGTRFCYSPLDQLAKVHRVRIIHPDRPGVGGSDSVDLHERIQAWLEMIPHLLAYLEVSYITIASHSGGIIYALNTILNYPQFFHPKRPYIAFFAPWVHQSHSRVPHLKVADWVPGPLVGKFASIAKFMNNSILPLAGSSITFFHNIKGSLAVSAPAVSSSSSTWALSLPSVRSLSDTTRRTPKQEVWDFDWHDEEMVTELRRLITMYMFAESINGISADARLFLKKTSRTRWSFPPHLWSDMDDFVPLLLENTVQERASGNWRKWTVDTFHAESDEMIGTRGSLWFDRCWEPALGSADLEYNSQVVHDASHNALLNPVFGAAGKWMQSVRESFLEGDKQP
ncbi:hypothetical protein GQ43DRAFT_116066 [Delitschia confertaspora ATCC 74209]|uniref:AB hydrolase-1 domain-containing protein n=1 Tax=Delitschia confertaspora ATCC 74209 TaxID=1513339 RepID=A0A9P4JTD8_9PLEO|nr:hypothetical protein GQ43DRAFT_116066 [Delitschia confertaspora ATCC 74209]